MRNPLKTAWQVTFKLPTPFMLATTELEDAERALLTAQTAAEYATSIVGYNQARITRLRSYINKLTNSEVKPHA